MYDVRSFTHSTIGRYAFPELTVYITVNVGIRHANPFIRWYPVRYILPDRCFTFWSAVR
jgi:hypothetical protein